MDKNIVKLLADHEIKLFMGNMIPEEEFILTIRAVTEMLPESIKQWNTTYTPNLYEDWSAKDFLLWYTHTFSDMDIPHNIEEEAAEYTKELDEIIANL